MMETMTFHPSMADNPPYVLFFHGRKLCIDQRIGSVTEIERLQWLDRHFPFSVMLNLDGLGSTPKVQKRNGANQFAHDHCGHIWMVIGYRFYFENQKEAAIFRLHWG